MRAAATGVPSLLVVAAESSSSSPALSAGAPPPLPPPPLDEPSSERSCCSRRFMFLSFSVEREREREESSSHFNRWCEQRWCVSRRFFPSSSPLLSLLLRSDMTRNQNVSSSGGGGGGGGAYILDRSLVPRIRLLAQVRTRNSRNPERKQGSAGPLFPFEGEPPRHAGRLDVSTPPPPHFRRRLLLLFLLHIFSNSYSRWLRHRVVDTDEQLN